MFFKIPLINVRNNSYGILSNITHVQAYFSGESIQSQDQAKINPTHKIFCTKTRDNNGRLSDPETT
jgi:hypothetical protein